MKVLALLLAAIELVGLSADLKQVALRKSGSRTSGSLTSRVLTLK